MSGQALTMRPLGELTRRVARNGWPELRGREFAAVRAILTWFPSESGEAVTTAHQLGELTGLCEKTIRRALTLMESMGLVTWRRGHVVEGRPTPSWVRISKKWLVALIGGGRKAKDQREADQAAAFRGRMDKLRVPDPTIWPRKRHNRRSVHADTKTSLPPFGGFPPAPAAGEGPETDPHAATRRTAARMPALRAALANVVR